MTLPSAGTITRAAELLTGAAVTAAVAAGAALLLHAALFTLLSRFARLSPVSSDEVVVARIYQPLRWLLVAVAVALAAETQPALAHAWDSVARFVVPALLGWVAFALVKAFAMVMRSRADLSGDEIAVRSRRTRITILSRTAGFMIVFITVALMLLGIPGVRNIGVTLMASAGLAGLAVGAAAQPALKSIIAGVQMAITEPVRIDDLVVIDGETGRVEDIRMSYVVVRTADERRLIVPTLKFLDTTFQNWTRVSGGISGAVIIPIKPGSPIPPIRASFERLLAEQAEWDGRTGQLQVNEARVGSIELKLVVSANDPAALAALRFALREAMLEWLRVAMPDALCREA